MKFVEFDRFCPSCMFFDSKESDICDKCLQFPARPYTRMPIKFIADPKKPDPLKKSEKDE